MPITCQAQVYIEAKPEQVFDLVIDNATLPKAFLGYGPIPAILSATVQGGGPLRVGAIRKIQNSDGSIIDEEITALDRPRRQAYTLLRGFKFPFSVMIRTAKGDWSIQPQNKGTQIVWDYSFEVTSFIFQPLAAFIVRRYFKQAQVLCLQNIKKLVEARAVQDT